MDTPLAQSFIYVGGLSVVATYLQKQMNLGGSVPGDGSMNLQMYAVPIGAAVLGYYWYGQMGAVGGVAGAIAGAYILKQFSA